MDMGLDMDEDLSDADIEFLTKETEALEQLSESEKKPLVQYIKESDDRDLDIEYLKEYEYEVTAVLDKYGIPYTVEDDDEE